VPVTRANKIYSSQDVCGHGEEKSFIINLERRLSEISSSKQDPDLSIQSVNFKLSVVPAKFWSKTPVPGLNEAQIWFCRPCE
jgi:hypothetical protein